MVSTVTCLPSVVQPTIALPIAYVPAYEMATLGSRPAMGIRPTSWRAAWRKSTPLPSTPMISVIIARGSLVAPGGQRQPIAHHQLVLREHDHVAQVERRGEHRDGLGQSRREGEAGVGARGALDDAREDRRPQRRKLRAERDLLVVGQHQHQRRGDRVDGAPASSALHRDARVLAGPQHLGRARRVADDDGEDRCAGRRKAIARQLEARRTGSRRA